MVCRARGRVRVRVWGYLSAFSAKGFKKYFVTRGLHIGAPRVKGISRPVSISLSTAGKWNG